jgi:hypothetical protein
MLRSLRSYVPKRKTLGMAKLPWVVLGTLGDMLGTRRTSGTTRTNKSRLLYLLIFNQQSRAYPHWKMYSNQGMSNPFCT